PDLFGRTMATSLANANNVRPGSFHSVFWIPGALFFAHVNDLANVVSVMRADVRKQLGIFLELGFVSRFNPLLQIAEDFIELLHYVIPALLVEIIERVVVVAAEFVRLLAFELCQALSIPEDKVIRELPD